MTASHTTPATDHRASDLLDRLAELAPEGADWRSLAEHARGRWQGVPERYCDPAIRSAELRHCSPPGIEPRPAEEPSQLGLDELLSRVDARLRVPAFDALVSLGEELAELEDRATSTANRLLEVATSGARSAATGPRGAVELLERELAGLEAALGRALSAAVLA